MATLPIDHAVHSRAFARCPTSDRVPDEFALFSHVGDREVAERARVVRLPATGRIERCAVECDRSISRRDDRGIERREVRVAQIEKFGQ